MIPEKQNHRLFIRVKTVLKGKATLINVDSIKDVTDCDPPDDHENHSSKGKPAMRIELHCGKVYVTYGTVNELCRVLEDDDGNSTEDRVRSVPRMQRDDSARHPGAKS